VPSKQTAEQQLEAWKLRESREDDGILTELDVNWLPLLPRGGERIVKAILESPANLSLVSLSLSHASLKDEGCRHIARLVGSNQTISSLDLSSNFISCLGAEALASSLKVNSTLRSLDLSDNQLGPRGLALLLEALKESGSMKHVNLSRNGLSSSCFRSIAFALAKNQVSLLSLSLSEGGRMCSSDGNQLGAVMRMALMRNSSLTSLGLRDNKIGDVGLTDMAEAMKGNRRLRHLDLSQNRIAMAGVRKLMPVLKCNETMKSLDLSCNEISSDEKMDGLVEVLRGNTSLTALVLVNNSCQEAAKEIEPLLLRNRRYEEERMGSMAETVASFAHFRSESRAIADNKLVESFTCEDFLSLHREMVTRRSVASASEAPAEKSRRRERRAQARRAQVVYVNRNIPQRDSLGKKLVLPSNISDQSLLTWLLSEANRLLYFGAWPGRCVFLDEDCELRGEEGEGEPRKQGAEIFAQDLAKLRDGVRLVISDGRGDGCGTRKKYHKRDPRKRTVRRPPDWEMRILSYWSTFVKFYILRRNILQGTELKEGVNSAGAF